MATTGVILYSHASSTDAAPSSVYPVTTGRFSRVSSGSLQVPGSQGSNGGLPEPQSSNPERISAPFVDAYEVGVRAYYCASDERLIVQTSAVTAGIQVYCTYCSRIQDEDYAPVLCCV